MFSHLKINKIIYHSKMSASQLMLWESRFPKADLVFPVEFALKPMSRSKKTCSRTIYSINRYLSYCFQLKLVWNLMY